MHSPGLLTRRQTLRLLGGAVIAAVPALRLAGDAAAGRSWCRRDPSFLVDGLVGNVYVSGELDLAYDTTGPIQLRFSVPEGTRVELLATDPGFGHGYDITCAELPTLENDEQSIDIQIEVVVPAISDRLPILVEFVPDATIEFEDHKLGTTNDSIVVKTRLRKPDETKEQKKARKDAEKENR